MENTPNQNMPIMQGRNLVKVVVFVVVILLVARVLCGGFNHRNWFMYDDKTPNTISVAGTAQVSAVPDGATFTYSVMETATTVADAQNKATQKTNDIIEFLKSSGIADKDIKTEGYNINPQYSYSTGICSTYSCPPGKQTITGYEVSQTVMVKVRDTAKAGNIVSGIGSKGASNISGLSFTIDTDREEQLKAEARDEAIASAREKAESIARSLGVKIVRVTAFTEDGGGRVFPVLYGAKAMSADGVAESPEIPTGENNITSNVTVTFEIR